MLKPDSPFFPLITAGLALLADELVRRSRMSSNSIIQLIFGILAGAFKK
jgi:hypothetical protein